MTQKTQAEQNLLDYVLEHEGRTSHDVLLEMIRGVRASESWPGAVTEDECGERYEAISKAWASAAEHLTAEEDRAGWARVVADVNRALADGAAHIVGRIEADADVKLSWIKGLLPKRDPND